MVQYRFHGQREPLYYDMMVHDLFFHFGASYCFIGMTLVLVTRCSSLLSKFEVLGSLKAQLLLGLARLALQTQNNLTGSLGLLVEDGLGLSSKSHLLRVVTSLPLRKVGSLAGLVLCYLVNGVLLALSGTVSLALFRNIHHFEEYLFLTGRVM